MQRSSLIFFCFFLLYGFSVLGQQVTISSELKQIDTLIERHQFALAQRKIDGVKLLLARNKQIDRYEELSLENRYLEIRRLDNQDQAPSKVLPLLLELLDESALLNLPKLKFQIYLLIALSYEKSGFMPEDFELTKRYLDMAYTVYKTHNLEELYSQYCVRLASYYRYAQKPDSLAFYANKAYQNAKKYNQSFELEDAYTMLISVAKEKQNYKSALLYSHEILEIRKKNNYNLGISYINVANIYLLMKDYKQSLAYIDSAYRYYDQISLIYKPVLSEIKSRIYEGLGNIDSAFFYFKEHSDYMEQIYIQQNLVKTKELEEKYQNDKKELAIKNRELLLILIGSLLTVIFVAWLLVMRKNRQISGKNKIINAQLLELTRTLEQKQVLLSELQHRVKNNLQHVISILEIQKESVDFNNIDELIRGNQNRIHSMALLHKKLSVSENVNEVDLERYLSELAMLVKDSYDTDKKKISMQVSCDIVAISLEKALPLGLIITELISNSMKHAFKKKSSGHIEIKLLKTESGKELYYADNGIGFDFNKLVDKGLGQEIIKGLIDQLDGKVASRGDNGFELRVWF